MTNTEIMVSPIFLIFSSPEQPKAHNVNKASFIFDRVIIKVACNKLRPITTVQPDSFSTVGAFSTVDPVVGRIYVQCKSIDMI